ncbi:hypothetical protein Hypma_003885 [Hypsizygus marmoreus]|uniref:Uncharacterized protein n=1 Tax=Hypsizygus marmoreus TaxID=39966 RepID=A0A369K9J6_HYPMA|nr:hypothetical protein Hypma_003885 [Hypsizygus marmoreus]
MFKSLTIQSEIFSLSTSYLYSHIFPRPLGLPTIMQQPDRGANYNAFGRDPNGRLAFLASFFYGPEYVPKITIQQFGGPAEPPRYGPPARYQLHCLPVGFQPQRPPNFLDPDNLDAEDNNLLDLDPDESPYLDPPAVFYPSMFAALQHVPRFQQFMPEPESDIETDIDEEDDEEDREDGNYDNDSADEGDESHECDEEEEEEEEEEED